MYATALNLLHWFDVREIAQLATPSQYTVVTDVLLELTITGGDRSSYSPQDIQAADAAVNVINEALNGASKFMDSYLESQYQLPLPQGQIGASTLPPICGDIARYKLYDDKPTDVVRKRFEDALHWLRDVAAGRASLGAGEPASTTSGGSVVVSGPGRIFSRNSMKGL